MRLCVSSVFWHFGVVLLVYAFAKAHGQNHTKELWETHELVRTTYLYKYVKHYKVHLRQKRSNIPQ